MTKRRKPPVFERKTVRVTPEMAKEFMSYGRICAWRDCANAGRPEHAP